MCYILVIRCRDLQRSSGKDDINAYAKVNIIRNKDKIKCDYVIKNFFILKNI